MPGVSGIRSGSGVFFCCGLWFGVLRSDVRFGLDGDRALTLKIRVFR